VSSCHCTIKGSNLVKHSKVGQTVNSGQRLVKGEGFNCKYRYFWISQQIWTIGLEMAYLEN